MREAMRAGHVEAQNGLAGLLLKGAGGPREEAEGRRLLQDAARRGSVGANVTLSMLHTDGAGGFERDLRRAFQHMQAAAAVEKPKNGWVLWRLGMVHLQGSGTPRNSQEAYRWVVRAADKGSIDGMISRAVMLATGDGVAENKAEARSWYERAARSGEKGWAHALRSLGGMHVIGEGGPVDLPRGFGYLLVAHTAGDELAGKMIENHPRQANSRRGAPSDRRCRPMGPGAAGERLSAFSSQRRPRS
jgi:TPR repeat protein